jgi:hypothetical protein
MYIYLVHPVLWWPLLPFSSLHSVYRYIE